MFTAIASLVLGLVLVYFLLGLLVVALVEWWAQLSGARGRMLRHGIAALLGEPRAGALTDALMNHALVASLKHGARLPAYMPGHTFTLALFDLLVNGRDPGVVERQPVQHLSQLINATRDRSADFFPRPLLLQLSLLLELAQDYDEALLVVEHWFNDNMARVRGWYKRQTQLLIGLVALILAALLNADSLLIGQHLLTGTTPDVLLSWSCLSECEAGNLSTLQPLQGTAFWALKVVGLLLTALAVSIFAPLVFDLLARIMHLRSNGTRLV